MQEAAKAYQDMQVAAEAQASVLTPSAPIPDASALGSVEAPMEVDHPDPERGTKRGPEEDEAPESHKKARFGTSSLYLSSRTLMNMKKKTFRAETSAIKKVWIATFYHIFILTNAALLIIVSRDRENSTVFVAELPQGVSEEDLSNLFNDVSFF